MFSYCMEKKGINIEQTVDKNGINLETAVMEYDYYADICDCFYELKALYGTGSSGKGRTERRREVTEVKNMYRSIFQKNFQFRHWRQV